MILHQLHDMMIAKVSGPEPPFDPVLRDFLMAAFEDLLTRSHGQSLLEWANLGREVPWLYRLTFKTRGLARGRDPEIRVVDRHVVAVRFLPDYLRRADRFEMLSLIEPRDPFHPNLANPASAICVSIYPGQSIADICESLHALFGWKLRQLAENNALNRDACIWGRAHIDDLPIDTRPLFGQPMQLTLEPVEEKP
jgi:hypothetical protein